MRRFGQRARDVRGDTRNTDIQVGFEEETLGAAANQSNAAKPLVAKQAPMVLVTFGVPGNLVGEGPFQKAAIEVIQALDQRREISLAATWHSGR